jgi:hypothetical protein
MDPPSRHGGGEDEANYSLTWFPHYLITGSEAARTHFEHLRDLLAGWVDRDCIHGYEPEAEAHHGTEPFLLFLPRHLGLFPDDGKARDLLEDAAHHIGNWVPEIPAWYDWDRDRFCGFRLATRDVEENPAAVVELAEHFRFLHIALAAHRVTGEDQYVEWALRYGRRRAKMLVEIPDGPLPLMWGPNEEPLWEGDMTEAQERVSAKTMHVPGDPLMGVEVLLASGAIYALGDLFLASGDKVFQEAARRIAEPLVPELHDPYGDPAAAAVEYYLQTFDDRSMDEDVRKRVEDMPPEDKGELMMMFPEKPRRVLRGVGKRADMIWWGILADAETRQVRGVREPSTAALALAYHVTGDADFARRAFKQAVGRLRIARRVLRGGREHADMGGAVCSVAAGHGRNWGWGSVTGCYGPLVLGTREIKSAVRPTVEVRRGGGEIGLPEEVLSLVTPAGPSDGGVRFYNGGEAEVDFQWRPEGGEWTSISIRPGKEEHHKLA